jgi:hypothetical protein
VTIVVDRIDDNTEEEYKEGDNMAAADMEEDNTDLCAVDGKT